MNDQDRLRQGVADLLRGGHAHVTLDQALEGLPAEQRAERPDGFPYSVWEVLEHMRIAQEDILRYTLDPDWRSPPWPEGYWPERPGAVDDETWSATHDGFVRDRDALIAMVQDPQRDLAGLLPHGEGRTYLRQALVAADHNAYHLGQIVAVRRALGAWPH